MLKETTNITKANSKSDSLRATIPAVVVKALDLKPDDQLEWEIEPDKPAYVVKVKRGPKKKRRKRKVIVEMEG